MLLQEELADGLHLIDFEQLKIENQTYNEKIEERNEELLKLRKKITNTVQVLTHLKEKLQFVQGENSLLKNKLKDVEGAVAQVSLVRVFAPTLVLMLSKNESRYECMFLTTILFVANLLKHFRSCQFTEETTP